MCALTIILCVLTTYLEDKCATERQLCACQNQLIIQIERAARPQNKQQSPVADRAPAPLPVRASRTHTHATLPIRFCTYLDILRLEIDYPIIRL